MFYKFAAVFSALFLILNLNGCGDPTRPDPESKMALSQIKVDPDIALAQRLSERGDYQKALLLYQRLAKRFGMPAKQRYLFFAIENALLADQPKVAKSLLSQLLQTGLVPNQQVRFNILDAQTSLALNEPEKAMLSLLEVDLDQPIKILLKRRYHRVFAKTYQALGNEIEMAHQLQQLDLLLAPSQQKLANQQNIIDILKRIPKGQLRMLSMPKGDVEKGWIDLAHILSSPQRRTFKLNQWRQTYPSHPVMHELIDFENSNEITLTDDMEIQQIGVLLPLSGRYAKISKVIQNGIMTAVFNLEPSLRPIVHFYDTSNPQDIWPLYSEAVSAGANWVIGPLNKEAVSLLAHAEQLPIPVLALNRVELDIAPPSGFFQFGLAPEDDATEAVLEMQSKQLQNPLILTPNNHWGERMRLAFAQKWQDLGGQVVAEQTYNPKAKDFSDVIKKLLNLQDSEKRKQQIQRILGRKLEFVPHRRSDADVIFIAAKKPTEARLIRPQIQFQHAFDLPVYANSNIWNGVRNKRQDIDLESVLFPYPKILLTESIEPQNALNQIQLALSSIPKKQASLFLMGVDSLNVLYQLPRLQADTQENYEGLTGILTLNEINQLHRQQMWAQFKEGIPVPIGYRASNDDISDPLQPDLGMRD